MHDLAVVIVSHNDADWLSRCLSSVYAHAGNLLLDVVVVENGSTEKTIELVRDEFPAARTITCENRGFGHGNNRALLTCCARYVLFLNPDTEILEGTFEHLISILDERPQLGLVSVRQVTADGALSPTVRHFPNAMRALGEAIGSERLLWRPDWLGERVLDLSKYDSELDCDWFTGAFMIARCEALAGAGIFDERFFLFSEEVDLAHRIKQAGWRIVHLPQMTILHHVHTGAPVSARMHAQYAFARRQYAEKHFSTWHRSIYLSMVRARYRIRRLAALLSSQYRSVGLGSQVALRTLSGLEPPPFGDPPATALEAPIASGLRERTSIDTSSRDAMGCSRVTAGPFDVLNTANGGH